MFAVLVGGQAHCGGQRGGLECLAHDVHFGELGDRELGDGVARVQPVLHQSLPAERLEAFTHRNGADPEQVGNVADRDRRTGGTAPSRITRRSSSTMVCCDLPSRFTASLNSCAEWRRSGIPRSSYVWSGAARRRIPLLTCQYWSVRLVAIPAPPQESDMTDSHDTIATDNMASTRRLLPGRQLRARRRRTHRVRPARRGRASPPNSTGGTCATDPTPARRPATGSPATA